MLDEKDTFLVRNAKDFPLFLIILNINDAALLGSLNIIFDGISLHVPEISDETGTEINISVSIEIRAACLHKIDTSLFICSGFPLLLSSSYSFTL